MSSNLGTLWIVSTPLGNLGDFSPRAHEVLIAADLVLAEDTRRSGQLLAKCGINNKNFMSLHDHNEEERLEKVLSLLGEGKNLALVSDAGTPLLSDPGFLLVRACRKAGLKVVPVPGASAPIVALSASGFPPQPFVFLGFAPRKRTDQCTFFAPYARLGVTIIFFERKDRLSASLASAYEVLGQREVCIARELTKTYEEFIYLQLSEHKSLPENLLGEMTVLIAPSTTTEKDSEEAVLMMYKREELAGGKPREIAKRVQAKVFGWSVGEIYTLVQGLP